MRLLIALAYSNDDNDDDDDRSGWLALNITFFHDHLPLTLGCFRLGRGVTRIVFLSSTFNIKISSCQTRESRVD